MTQCRICGHETFRSGLYLDCGGDCLVCMSECGDDDCTRSVAALAKKYHHELEIVKANLFRGMSKSMQRLQARTIDEVLSENAD